MRGKKNEKPDFSVLKTGYMSSLSDFADFLGTMDEADKAAKELLAETGAALSDNAPKTEAEKSPEKPDLNELLAQLDALVGLTEIKANIRSLTNLVKIRKLREEQGLSVPPISLHMVFMGNPGTGKTTVARLVSQLYFAIGALSKGQLVEVDRGGLVAGYVGQTAIKTAEVVKSAIGGVLFIDEAYALVSEGSNDFGHEAIETLLKAMEDNRNDLVVIVAGYDELMDKFISSNPGLQSRFNRYFNFPDYNGEELMTIFSSMISKNDYALTEDAEIFAKKHFRKLYEDRDDNFGNARDVRNFFENAVSAHSDRLAAMDSPTIEDLMSIGEEDLKKAAEKSRKK